MTHVTFHLWERNTYDGKNTIKQAEQNWYTTAPHSIHSIAHRKTTAPVGHFSFTAGRASSFRIKVSGIVHPGMQCHMGQAHAWHPSLMIPAHVLTLACFLKKPGTRITTHQNLLITLMIYLAEHQSSLLWKPHFCNSFSSLLGRILRQWQPINFSVFWFLTHLM